MGGILWTVTESQGNEVPDTWRCLEVGDLLKT